MFRCERARLRWTACLLVAWEVFASPVAAVVQVLPNATLTVDGRVLSDQEAVADDPTVRTIRAAFERAEAAVQSQNLDGLMTFYGKAFNYHGLRQPDVRRIWTEVFEHYRDLSSTHLFSDVKLTHDGTLVRVEITCTGGLYGTERKSGKAVTLDSWFREVHYLVKEDGAWRFVGNAGDAPTAAPFASVPHHPLF